MKEPFKQKMLRAMGAPESVARDQPEICMIGFERISVENYKSILKYTQEEILLRLIQGKLQMIGRNLFIKEIGEGSICVEGKVQQICFIEEGE